MKHVLSILTAAALLAVLVVGAVAPGAAAEDQCAQIQYVQVLETSTGIYWGDCVGVWVHGIPTMCHGSIWGYHGDDYGVGGTNGCRAGAYVTKAFINSVLP